MKKKKTMNYEIKEGIEAQLKFSNCDTYPASGMVMDYGFNESRESFIHLKKVLKELLYPSKVDDDFIYKLMKLSKLLNHIEKYFNQELNNG